MPKELTESESFVLLADRRRRLAIQVLRETTSPLLVIELSRRIGNRTSTDPSAEEVRSIHITLHHNHLPRLHQAGVVVYDVAEGTVRPGVNFDLLTDVLEGVRERERPWSNG